MSRTFIGAPKYTALYARDLSWFTEYGSQYPPFCQLKAFDKFMFFPGPYLEYRIFKINVKIMISVKWEGPSIQCMKAS